MSNIYGMERTTYSYIVGVFFSFGKLKIPQNPRNAPDFHVFRGRWLISIGGNFKIPSLNPWNISLFSFFIFVVLKPLL